MSQQGQKSFLLSYLYILVHIYNHNCLLLYTEGRYYMEKSEKNLNYVQRMSKTLILSFLITETH